MVSTSPRQRIKKKSASAKAARNSAGTEKRARGVAQGVIKSKRVLAHRANCRHAKFNLQARRAEVCARARDKYRRGTEGGGGCKICVSRKQRQNANWHNSGILVHLITATCKIGECEQLGGISCSDGAGDGVMINCSGDEALRCARRRKRRSIFGLATQRSLCGKPAPPIDRVFRAKFTLLDDTVDVPVAVLRHVASLPTHPRHQYRYNA